MKTIYRIAASLLLLCLVSPTVMAQTVESKPYRDTLGLGLNYLGVQIRYRFYSHWAAELRTLTGRHNADEGEVTARVMGLRVYRFLPRKSRWQYYLGGEAATVKADQNSTNYQATGSAVGMFGGADYRLGKRFSVGLDIGPYVFSLQEKTADASETSLSFVANSYVCFYFF